MGSGDSIKPLLTDTESVPYVSREIDKTICFYMENIMVQEETLNEPDFGPSASMLQPASMLKSAAMPSTPLPQLALTPVWNDNFQDLRYGDSGGQDGSLPPDLLPILLFGDEDSDDDDMDDDENFDDMDDDFDDDFDDDEDDFDDEDEDYEDEDEDYDYEEDVDYDDFDE